MRTSFLALLVFCMACGKENISYPKSYTFFHVDQSEEGLFLITDNNTTQELDVNTGAYGDAREEILEESAEVIRQIYDLQEIELLSEDMVRIHIIIDEEEIDTIVTYTVEDENIIIEALGGSDIIVYDPEADQFVVCGFTTIALPGPNANQSIPYYQTNIEDCLEDGDLEEHVSYALDQYELEISDTLVVFITRIVYD